MQPMDPISGKLNDSAAPSEDEVAVSLNHPVSKFPIIENVKFGGINKAIKSQKIILTSIIKTFMKTHSFNHQIYTESVLNHRPFHSYTIKKP